MYTVALLCAAIVLYGMQPLREANRWAALFLLFASLGGLAGFIREQPQALAIQWVERWVGPDAVRIGCEVLAAANHTLTPYGVLVFCIVYSAWGAGKSRNRWKALLLLPPLGTTVMYAAVGEQTLFFIVLAAWAVPYYAVGCWLLVASAMRELDRYKRRERWAVAALTVPTTLAIAGWINVASIWVPDYRFFDYIAYFITYSLLVGVACAFGSGVLGIRVKIEREPLEQMVGAVGTGTAMLNHTIKNEIAKISLCADNVRNRLAPDDRAGQEQLELIVKASEHLSAMIGRMHGQTKPILLKEQPMRLAACVSETLKRLEPKLEQSGIAVAKLLECDPVLIADRYHLSEAIGNIVNNAIEAMQGRADGRLIVRLSETRRGYELTLTDNGPGMTKGQLKRALEPFYTTKSAAEGSFGLGLTYCYQVMRQSGGAIEVDSKEERGTTVRLLLPFKKKLRFKTVRATGAVAPARGKASSSAGKGEEAEERQ